MIVVSTKFEFVEKFTESYLFDQCVIIARENFYDSLIFENFEIILLSRRLKNEILFDYETTRYIIF